MSQVDAWLALVGGLILLLGLGAGVLEANKYLPTQPILAVGFGIALGPHGLAVLQLTPIADPLRLLEQVARITVAFAVTSIALRLPPPYFRRRARSLAAILGPGMVVMWLASTLVVYAVLPVGPLVALLVGAVVTPTDPVLANAIVGGTVAEENIPEPMRYLLSGEAGINDGTAYLFVLVPVLALTRPPEVAVVEWLTRTLLVEVLGAVVLGAAAGATIGRLERWESARAYLEGASVLTITVALTFFVLGAVALAGSDGILAVFVAGVAYNWQADPSDEAAEQRIEEVFDRLFTIPAFVVFGMAIPWSGWIDLGWRAPTLVLGILLFRRLPMVFALRRFLPQLDRFAASLFAGWFGPIGLAAVFYAVLAAERTGVETAWVACSLVVVGSILAHGMTATAATLRYGGLSASAES
ncbi:cation:proton antiporter [Haloferacaceae archaeon DSL9]